MGLVVALRAPFCGPRAALTWRGMLGLTRTGRDADAGYGKRG